MSNTKHTPERWVARISEFGIDVIRDDDSAFGICDLGTRKTLEDANYPFEEAKSNAKLIAAAPSLLEILIECEEYFDNKADYKGFDDDGNPEPDYEMQMLTKIRNVIQKTKP